VPFGEPSRIGDRRVESEAIERMRPCSSIDGEEIAGAEWDGIVVTLVTYATAQVARGQCSMFSLVF